MKKIFKLVASVFVFSLLPGSIFADTIVSGNIEQNQIWRAADGPYYLEDVYIAPGVTVTVEPGVHMYNNGSISVFGELNINGEINNKDIFELNPDYLSWSIYVGGGGKLNMKNTILSQVDGVVGSNAKITLSGVDIVDASSGVIGVDGSEIDVSSVHISGLLSGTAITAVGGSRLTVSGSYLEDSLSSNDYIVAGYQKSTVTIIDTEFVPLFSVPVIMVGSELLLSHVTMSGGSEDGVQLVPLYDIDVISSKARIENSTITNFEGNGIFGVSPVLQINDSTITGNGVGVEIIGQNDMSVTMTNSSIEDSNAGVFYVKQGNDFIVNFDIRNNWWGDASGPGVIDKNNNGLGDLIVGYNGALDDINFTPWLVTKPQDKCCSSVLFIPGLKGSRLYKSGILENQLWEPNRNADVEKLYLDSTGKSLDQSIYTRDIIDRTNIGFSIFDQNIYKSFVSTMDGMVNEGGIKEWKALPYDWRLNYDDLVSNGIKLQNEIINIIPEVERLAKNSKTGKVSIVTHSNGGLFAKFLINKLKETGKETLVDNLIMVAAPQLGTPDTIPALLHGDNQDISIIVDKNIMRTLGENMKSAYNLLPSKKYFDTVTDSVITFDPSIDKIENFRAKYGDTITSYTDLTSFLLAKKDGRKKPQSSDTTRPNIVNSSLVATADNLHTTIDNWTAPSNIKLTEIAGWGISTTKGINYLSRIICSPITLVCAPGLDREAIKSIDGDGTVLTPSAVVNDGERYYVNIRDYNRGRSGIDHGSILEIPNLESLIKNIILNKSETIPEFITKEKPVDTGHPNIRIAMHSPVAIDAYDDEGRHTGLVSVPGSDLMYVEKAIPNSQYEEVGEGKYIYIDGDKAPTIKLQGLDSGTFSLNIQTLNDNKIVTESSFTDVPTNPAMEGQVIVMATSTSLALDVEGDGKNDVVIGANVELDPVTYLTIIKKTINGFDISTKTKNEFIKRIDAILKLVEKGKVKNAVKKVKDFNKKLQGVGKHHDDRRGHKKLNKTDTNTFVTMLNELLDLLEVK